MEALLIAFLWSKEESCGSETTICSHSYIAHIECCCCSSTYPLFG